MSVTEFYENLNLIEGIWFILKSVWYLPVGLNIFCFLVWIDEKLHPIK